jgi:hypothetical protein
MPATGTKSKAVRVTDTKVKPTTVAEYVAQQIVLCGKDQTTIAEEVGFNKPNVITMIKQGKTKVPLERIGSMAKALNVDPVFFLKLCINEYLPDLMPAITAITGQPIITANEMEFINVIRSSKVSNPKLRTPEDKKRLKEVVDTLKGDNEVREE